MTDNNHFPDVDIEVIAVIPAPTRLFHVRSLETGEEAIVATRVSRRPLGAIFSFLRGEWTYVASHREHRAETTSSWRRRDRRV